MNKNYQPFLFAVTHLTFIQNFSSVSFLVGNNGKEDHIPEDLNKD